MKNLVLLIVCVFAASGAFAKNIMLKFENGSCVCFDKSGGCTNVPATTTCSDIKGGDKCPAACADKIIPLPPAPAAPAKETAAAGKDSPAAPPKDAAAPAKDAVAPAKDAAAAKATAPAPAAPTSAPAAGGSTGTGAPKN